MPAPLSLSVQELNEQARLLATAYTLEEIEEHLALWKKAEKALATSQSYTVKGRTLTRVDAAEIRNNILLYARAKAIKADPQSTRRPRIVRAVIGREV